MSVQELASELGVRPGVVEAWELGTKRVPAHRWRKVAWLLAAFEHDAILRDLAPCDWVRAWEARSQEEMDKTDLVRHYRELETHASGCQKCQEREDHLKTHARPLPSYPFSWAERLEFSVIGAIDRLWAGGRRGRPVLLTAAALAAAAGLRYAPRSNVWAVLLYPIALAAAIASGFGVYDLMPGLRGGGVLARWLARYIGLAVAAFLFGAVFIIGGYADVFGSSEELTLTWPALVVVSAFIALLWATFAGIGR